MYKVSFFVPHHNAEVVKEAMFTAGAGRMGNYERCSFEVAGTGQFKALVGANPSIGVIGKLVKVDELKIEMVCDDIFIQDVIEALKKYHPYEMPAYDVIKLEIF